MAPSKLASGLYRQGNNWYCNAGLPSDVTVEVEGVVFYLHKFPLMSRCGKITNLLEKSQVIQGESFKISLTEFPGGPDTFLIVVKFCYGVRVELSPKNILLVYCAADFLTMTEEYGEDNLLAKADSFFHKTILRNWKDCIMSLQYSEPVIERAEKDQVVGKCLNALAMMACTDPSLFGWPMMMYGSLQSPGGSILWNGINTGARIRSKESDWWFEDISNLSLPLFQKLIVTMKERGMRAENLAGAIMYYARKYLPGLGRWQGGQVGKTRTVVSLSMTPAPVDQKVALECIEKLLPEKKGKSFCRFLLGLLRVGMIVGVSKICQESLERRIGMQLDLATLDSLLMPSYSDSDTLYNTDCVERMVQHFISSGQSVTFFSPSSVNLETSPLSGPLRRVARLIDNYIAEIASDVNLKPEKLRYLAEALPESSRSLHDGLYRAVDIYFKAHPWLSDNEKEKLCNIIDYRKLSIDACSHASQNERLPLRIVLQVLFFEQLQLRTALTGYLPAFDGESGLAGVDTASNDMAGQVVQRGGWVTVVRENQVLRVDFERMRSRVGELEQEFCKIKQEMHKVTKSHSFISSPRLFARKLGCKLLPGPSDAQADVIESVAPSPRASVDQAHSRHRKSSSSLRIDP
ncbi:hypothetical protein IFM89_006088 [Coptis chinensis]|uniref:Phototropic-responsive NPH3 family protein n=1 Tax=Coptis chinensis TaxID=261450 RepID=A0A835LGL9_9MAGN|nr:hypothetical protein IFM89_006088 [Coptis chinensis]